MNHLFGSLYRATRRRRQGTIVRTAAGLAICTCAAVVFVAATQARQVEAPANSVGAVLLGQKNDGSYNESVYTGLNKAKTKLGVKLTVVENVTDPTRAIDVIRNLAQNNKLVVAGSTSFNTAVARVATDFPAVQFAVVGGRTKPTKNIHYVDIAPGPGGYLMGAIAAKLTKTKKVGFLGGCSRYPDDEDRDRLQARREGDGPCGRGHIGDRRQLRRPGEGEAGSCCTDRLRCRHHHGLGRCRVRWRYSGDPRVRKASGGV